MLSPHWRHLVVRPATIAGSYDFFEKTGSMDHFTGHLLALLRGRCRVLLAFRATAHCGSGGIWKMTKAVSKSQVFLARLVVGLMIAFVVGGLLWYGFSAEVRGRLWQNLFERPGGPMVFRFFLQPAMAAIAAWRDGVNDARSGRTPFFAGALADPAQRTVRLNEALVATARIILLGLMMDGIYQAIEFKTFHPAEAVIIALALAFVPYLLLRGLIARAARRWVGNSSSGHRQ